MGCCHSSVDLSAPFIVHPWVRVPSRPSTLFSIYIFQIVYLSFELDCEKNENKQKEAEVGPLFKKYITLTSEGVFAINSSVNPSVPTILRSQVRIQSKTV